MRRLLVQGKPLLLFPFPAAPAEPDRRGDQAWRRDTPDRTGEQKDSCTANQRKPMRIKFPNRSPNVRGPRGQNVGQAASADSGRNPCNGRRRCRFERADDATQISCDSDCVIRAARRLPPDHNPDPPHIPAQQQNQERQRQRQQHRLDSVGPGVVSVSHRN